MSTQVTDLHLVRDQLLVRRKKLEAATTKSHAVNLVQLLEEVDKALERVEIGSFGECEACKGAMETERLLADPLARFCLECLNPAEQRALEQDLQLASRIQAGLLPRQDLAIAGWKTSYHYEPAGPVSGDYCDLLHDGKHLYFMVGDVSGKGIAASMLMANLHATFRVLVPSGLPLNQLVERANRIFCGSTLPTQYATLIVGKADEYGTVEICNGGHPGPVHVSPKGVNVVQSEGLPIGLFHDQKFSTTMLKVAPGEALVVYTDGVSEAENPDGAQYSDSAFNTLLRECHALSSREIIERCIREVLAFRAGLPRLDDQTILALQFSPDGHFSRQH
ncbi:MAG TPA: SpoIIE family protein phosphatase [Candidatus Angelobacter sp.]|nr:SpoIIE family protein phosphatase [Candidatus Angelobacter sp.]